MKGKIESVSSKGDYKIESQGLKINVEYENWFSSKAMTKLNEENYEIKSNSIWHNNFTISQSGKEIGKISFNWKGNAILSLSEQEFILKFKGLLNRRFELENKESDLLMVIVPGIKWTKLKYDYEIEIDDKKIEADILQVLLFAVSYATNISTDYYWNA